ncbi:DUF1223 domain-containing protein [Pseudotenacibaculum haliotis]|uniref:DUF1223 domain-containing protein n=1 Tax=Pseudotenacibaculum haliotis TaxID=1862138 RepID=A0ABW5LWQ6_9FLAO
MKYITFLLFPLLFFSTQPETTDKPFVIVQLFTSQGCSSCPPADALVGKIKEEYKDQNVFVMSYHVDYWDRLGWKDPFSKREFTEIQYRYADQFRERQVYTPQIVVNGKEHFVGSDGSRLRRKIKNYLKKDAQNNIALSTQKDAKGNLLVNYNISGELKGKKLKLALVLNKHTTQIKRGENRNRTLTNSNVVLNELVLELGNKKSGSLTIPSSTLKEKGAISIIGFVQNEDLEITGANQTAI